jgi:hypothetical protein
MPLVGLRVPQAVPLVVKVIVSPDTGALAPSLAVAVMVAVLAPSAGRVDLSEVTVTVAVGGGGGGGPGEKYPNRSAMTSTLPDGL